jgi:BirA family biotin operon repressor/biotin-[acetyl-CoA-carboxylase] ligase
MAVPIAADLELLRLLADGLPHSGERLAATLGVSGVVVHDGIERLRLRGIDIEARPRQGYALPCAVELFEERAIRAALAHARTVHLRRLDLELDVDSTNDQLLRAMAPPPGVADVMLSELQHAGRGRRGRQWVAPFGGSIALSMARVFPDAARVSPALSLSAGVAVARALTRAGARGIGLKWPNDVWLDGRKIGGVLADLRSAAGGPAHVVIGIGINVALTPAARARIEASGVRVAAVADACAAPPSRNFIAGAIIDELLSMLAEFERDGFAPLWSAWTALDVLRDRPAQVVTGDTVVVGTARGVDAQGALQLERDGRREHFVSGEASLRAWVD